MRSTMSASECSWLARVGSKRAISSTHATRTVSSRSRGAGGISFRAMRTKKNAKRAARGPASRRAPPAKRAPEIFARLRRAYPDAHCALDFQSPYQLLVATILSAQCTDKRVNMVTPALFRRYATPAALAAADPDELEELIKSTGFYRNKTKSLIGMSTAVAEQHAGRIPDELDALVKLPAG